MCIGPAAIVEDLFWSMTHRFRARSQLGARTHAFRFKNKLLSLDSTTISLCNSVCFPGATFRRAKGGVKAHVLLDHDDYLPAYVLISQATMHDAKVLGLLRLNAGSIVAMDRAYNDYRQFARWTDAGVYFVTRMKDNAVYAVVDERDVPVHRNIHSDAIILNADRPPGAEQVSASASAHRRVGRGARAGDRAAHQSPRLRGHDRRRHLQGAVADRALLERCSGSPVLDQEPRSKDDGESRCASIAHLDSRVSSIPAPSYK